MPKPNGEDSLAIVNQCFIITPIGEINSEPYIKAMGLIEAVIHPVLKEFNLSGVAANHISSAGSINKQLIKAILEDKLVIANLTGLNPNVMYELAIRHAARLPVVIMAEYGTRLPFDINDQRTIFYNDSLAGLSEAKKQLRLMIEATIDESEPDNPIYQAIEQASILKNIKDGDPLMLIMERLDRIENSAENKQKPARVPDDIPFRNGYLTATVEGEFLSSMNNMEDINLKLREISKLALKINGVDDYEATYSYRNKKFRHIFYVPGVQAFTDLAALLKQHEDIRITSILAK